MANGRRWNIRSSLTIEECRQLSLGCIGSVGPRTRLRDARRHHKSSRCASGFPHALERCRRGYSYPETSQSRVRVAEVCAPRRPSRLQTSEPEVDHGCKLELPASFYLSNGSLLALSQILNARGYNRLPPRDAEGETTLKKLGLLVAILFTVPAFAQEIKHAPTVEQCRADVALWHNLKIFTEYNSAQTAWASDGVPNRTPTAQLPLSTIQSRLLEMAVCTDVDKPNHATYYETNQFYAGVVHDRYVRFLKRHGLMDQLWAEDAAGER